jgi:hypothetical protein
MKRGAITSISLRNGFGGKLDILLAWKRSILYILKVSAHLDSLERCGTCMLVRRLEGDTCASDL